MYGKITIGTVWEKVEGAENIYIGRGSHNPSPLGNPFIINGHNSRDNVCDRYAEYLPSQMNAGNQVILSEMNRIARLIMSGTNVNLQCYCKGKRCHGETIKEIIEDALTHRVVE